MIPRRWNGSCPSSDSYILLHLQGSTPIWGKKAPGVLPGFSGSFLALLFSGSLPALARLFSRHISRYYSALPSSSLRSFRFLPAFLRLFSSSLPTPARLFFRRISRYYSALSSFSLRSFRFLPAFPDFSPVLLLPLPGSFLVLFLAVLCPFGSGIFLHKLLFCQAAYHHVISLHGNTVHSSPSQYRFFSKSQSVQYLT